jgi:spore coat polysaccharide biosynthesis protein SpsF
MSKKSKINAIIQARLSSSRLPGKVLMKLDDKNTALDYVIMQLQQSKLLDGIIVATSNLEQDNPIEDTVKKSNIPCFRGDLQNTLDRYYQCAKKFNVDVIVRIPADKPLIDPQLVDDAISKFDTSQYDYLSNWLEPSVPSGTEVEMFTFNALEKAWREATTDYQKEHVSPYFYQNPEKFRIFSLKYNCYPTNVKYSLDTAEDLKFIKQIIKKISKRPIFTEEILRL